ncbi:MAG: type I-F CRISPR-associated protein Csy1 [Parahaliea sp.]
MPYNPGSFRVAIDQFLQERRQAKLDKLKPDDPKRHDIEASFERSTWLADAARRVSQIQAVTHSLKPVHPDARGTSLYVDPITLPSLNELGSHVLGTTFESDIVGNAAALDVYKLLKLEVNGLSLLSALLAQNPDALLALDEDSKQAEALCTAFISLTQARSGGPGSHALAKQLFWLTGDKPDSDSDYVLLAPLYATSLAHSIYQQIQNARFGDTNKAARQARREHKACDDIYIDYPDLAVQKMGGTKPQNISQLNSERGGINYLLSSLPPSWTSRSVRPPAYKDSVFSGQFDARPLVRQTIKTLKQFLSADPPANLETRQRREALIETLVDELVVMAGEIQQLLHPGWTLDKDIESNLLYGQLNRDEQLWLDPLRTELPGEADFVREWLWMDWPANVGKRFANWLNTQLEGLLPVGDAEAREWEKELLTDEEFTQQLRELRHQLEASHHQESHL